MRISLLSIIFILITGICYSKDYIIKKINVNGEQRLSESFILNFLPENKNNKFNDEMLNRFSKDLYQTGLFSKVNYKINNQILEIYIEEFPIINEVSFSGNDMLEQDQLKSIVNINPRDIFNKQNINDAVEKLRTEYQKIGRYLAEIKTKKIELSEGRVNINFEIKEGSLLVVKNINFIGNTVFSDNELKSKISTKEDAWYKIFGSNKFVPERLEYDKERLKEFYNERGYIDFQVKIARGDLLPDFSGFNINFIITEGKRFLIKDVNIETPLIESKKRISLLNDIYIKEGDYFDSRAMEETIKFLTQYFENVGFNFIKVSPSFKKDKNFVNIKFLVTEGDQKYINKIVINGNTRTNDTVIRRELSFFEGDAFNKSKLINSIKSIKRLGYFKSVKYKLENSTSNNSLDIIIDVEETNTGAVSFGVGYSSLNNTTVTFGLTEKNFLGEGKRVRFETSLADKKSTYNIGITEPYYLDRPLSLSGDIYSEESENSKGDIKSNVSGIGVGLGLKKELLFQKLGYRYSVSETTTASSSTASSSTGEEGIEIITSSVTYGLSKDTRDSYFNPTSGYNWRFNNTFAGIGGDSTFLKSVFNSKIYTPLDYGDYVFGLKMGAGIISALEDKITSSNRFRLGGRVLRGFDRSGIGPRDTGNNQSVGGNKFYNVSFELKSDEWMPEDTGLEWFVFSDLGSLWGTDYKNGVEGYDDHSPRVTNGFGLSMVTPVGPLQMVWGFPVKSESYDIEENFQFSIGTTF